MTLIEEFEELCKYIREVTGGDLVCGLCEYDAGTVGEEPMECPGFESNECFVLKESLRKQYEMYAQVIRCKDCKYWTGYYCQRVQTLAVRTITEENEFCSRAERKEENE